MENEELKSVQKAISMTIVEARNFASQIKKDTHEMEQDMRAKLRSKYGLEKKRLESYEESISCIREDIRNLLEKFDKELNEKLEDMHDIKSEMEISEPEPKERLTLFKKKKTMVGV
jgi:hypothetical protein